METNENNMQENVVETPTEEPKKKNNKGIMIGLIVVVVVALIGAGIFFSTRKSPLTMVNEGVEKTLASVRPGMGEYLGSKELNTFMETGVIEQSLKISLDNVTSTDEYTDMSMLNGTEIGVDAAIDRVNKKSDSNLYVSYGGTKLVDANFYANGNTVSISAPDYFEGFITADTTNFGADFNQSALATLLQVQLSGTEAFEMFPETEVAVEEASTETSNIITSMQQSVATYDEELMVEKTKNKKEFEIGGVMESCDEYSMAIPKKYLEAAMDIYMDYIKSMPAAQQEIIKTFIDEMEQMEFTDITAYLYLDKQGRLVNLSFDADYLLEDGNFTASVSLTAQGKEFLLDAFDCNISYIFGGDLGTMNIGWKKTTTVDGAAVTSNHEITLSDDEMSFLLNGSAMFNQETGELAITGTAAPDDGELGNVAFDLNGKFTEVTKGTGFTLDITDLAVKVDEGGLEESMSFSGSYRLAPLSREIKSPEGTEKNILTMSEEELSNFAMEVLMNFEQTPIGQLMGGLY